MAQQRKLSRPTDQRLALLRNQVTNLLYHGKIVTTEAKAKEVVKIAEKLITLAVKEKDNYTEVEKEVYVTKKEGDKKVRTTEKRTVKLDNPSKLAARKKLIGYLYSVVEQDPKHKKREVQVNLANKLFDEIAPKYEGRKGGYTRITKLGVRKGDGALEVLLELV